MGTWTKTDYNKQLTKRQLNEQWTNTHTYICTYIDIANICKYAVFPLTFACDTPHTPNRWCARWTHDTLCTRATCRRDMALRDSWCAPIRCCNAHNADSIRNATMDNGYQCYLCLLLLYLLWLLLSPYCDCAIRTVVVVVVVGYLVAMDIVDSFVWHQVGRPCAERPSDAANTIRHAKACRFINPDECMHLCVCVSFLFCASVCVFKCRWKNNPHIVCVRERERERERIVFFTRIRRWCSVGVCG